MYINEKTAEVLNDLIQINNDRVRGYEKAADETKTKDVDLQAIFRQMAAESRSYVNDLSQYVNASGEEPATSTTTSGKIYRAWMDVKATFTGKDRKAILASCEFGEDAAQKAYKEALEDKDLTPDVRATIENQKKTLRQAHDKIKSMRDVAAAAH